MDFTKRSGINLNKDTASQGVGVALANKGFGVITATLRWKSGMGAGRADLDLFGWVVGKDTAGRKGGLAGRFGKKDPSLATVVYHKNLGSLEQAPYFEHGGDSRTPGQEVMRLGSLEQQDFALFGVYQAFGNGVGSLKSFNAHVVVTDTEGNETVVNLTEDHANRYWAAIALVDLTHPQGYVIRPVEEYSRPGTEQSPLLRSDGSFVMNEGPEYRNK